MEARSKVKAKSGNPQSKSSRHSQSNRDSLLDRQAVEGEQAADGVFADAVLKEPWGTFVEEFEAGFRAGGEARIGLDAVLELGFEGGVFGHVFAGQPFQDVGFAVLLLLKDGIEEAPAEGGVGRIGFEPVDGDLGKALIERDDDRAGGEGKRFGGQSALT